MPSPKRRKAYNFLYTDQTVLTYELTKDDFEQVQESAVDGKTFVVTSIGIISLDGLRTAVEQKELTAEEKAAQKEVYLENAIASMTEESVDWLNEQKELLEKYSHEELVAKGMVPLI